MSNPKVHLAALSLLDRAFSAMSDDELATAVDSLPEDHRDAVDQLAQVGDGERIPAVRQAIAKGRINGTMEQLATVITDPCLAACIEQLGDQADYPSREDLDGVLPGLVEAHGLGVVRVMMASAVVGEAAASATLVEMLKRDETYKLPKRDERPAPRVVVEPSADEVAERERIKAARKERKAREQAEARARREQAARGKH